MTGQPETTEGRDDRLPSIIAVMIMGVSLIAAGFAYLQTQADNRSGIAGRRAEAEAVEVLGQLAIQERQIAHELALFGYANDLAWFSASLSQTGSAGLGYASDLGSAYAQAVTESSSFSSVIGGEYQRPDGLVEWARFLEEQRRPVYRATELQKAFEGVGGAWGGKAAKYVAIITVLAAALFLLGLTSNITEDARSTLAFSGASLALLASLWGVSVLTSDVPAVSERAVEAYVDGFIINSWADDGADLRLAERRFTDAIRLDPRYRDAYFGRSYSRFRLDLLDPDGPQGSAGAEEDLRTVLGFDDQSGIAWGNLGAVRFWSGDYQGSIDATRRALGLIPDEPTYALNLGFLLAISDDEEAYIRQLDDIRDKLVALPSWLRETVVFRYLIALELAEEHRPALSSRAAGYHERIIQIDHEISVGRRFFDDPSPEPVDATVPSLVLTALDDGTRILAEFTYEHVDDGQRWLYRTYVDGVEVPILSRVAEPWSLPVPAGQAFFEITAPSGLKGTTVRVEIFIEGNLLAAAEVEVPPPG